MRLYSSWSTSREVASSGCKHFPVTERHDEANGDREKLLRPAGLQWLSRILGRMDSWLDDNDGRFELA